MDAVYARSTEDGVVFDELFDLLEDNEDLRDWLSTGNYDRIDPRFNVIPVGSAIKAGFNIYRLKLWDGQSTAPIPFRLIFAVRHLPPTEILLLGLMPRFDPKVDHYEFHCDYSRRLRIDYEFHGIPRIN